MMRNTGRSRNTYLLCFIDFDRIKELCSDFLHGYQMMPQGFHIRMSGLWHICHIKQTMRQWNTYSYYSYINICSILKICLRLNTRNIFLKIHIQKLIPNNPHQVHRNKKTLGPAIHYILVLFLDFQIILIMESSLAALFSFHKREQRSSCWNLKEKIQLFFSSTIFKVIDIDIWHRYMIQID